ncbi:MAG TPA: hypothetical protein VLF39_03530 [Candidatus Saccharimonadales bacterium]|nr:hypothetical protein [Candidatus Saccharimonadales bacterium]
MAQKRKSPKPKAGAWFIKVRGSYLPASSAGWLLYLPYTVYLVFTLVAALNQTSSWQLAFLFIIPNWIAAFGLMTYIASKKS